MKTLYQISKAVNTLLILLEVHVNCIYTVEVLKYHTNCRLTFESFIRYYHLQYRLDRGLNLRLGVRLRSSSKLQIDYHGDSIGLVVKQ